MQDLIVLYQRFINLYTATETFADLPALSTHESKIIGILSTVWSRNEKISILKSMDLVKDYSLVTYLRHIKSLRKKGYIQLKVDESDNRVKLIYPTKQCEKYFARFGSIIAQAAAC